MMLRLPDRPRTSAPDGRPRTGDRVPALPRSLACTAAAFLVSLAAAAPLAAQRDTARREPPADSVARTAADSTTNGSPARAEPMGGGTADSSAAALPAPAPAAVEPAPRWPVAGPEPLPGAVLPNRRIIAYYGNPRSTRMGILGELPREEMLARLDAEVAAWTAADPGTPAQPALHLIAVVAAADSGRDGKYRMRMPDALVERVYGWAQEHGALLFLDFQVGLSTIAEELPRYEKWLTRPDVHVGIDPEFSMKTGARPGTRIGTYDADDVNWVSAYLGGLVERDSLPPKVLVVHRFTRKMLTNSDRIRLDPRVQVVIQMDGWGPPRLKRDSYRRYVWEEPVQYTGFKLFYKNDTKAGHPLMSPSDVLTLSPAPLYIQYQ